MALQTLTAVHVFSGTLALVTALLATATMFFHFPHKWHVNSGRGFVLGMTGIVVTAVPIAVMKSDHALLLIAVFSGYLAFTGWRYAKNRKGTANLLDWARIGVMSASSLAMILLGAWMIRQQNMNGITLLTFGVVGSGLCGFDTHLLRTGLASGKTRIAYHLTMMLSCLIATLTAFVVVNFVVRPMFILWLTPTVLITPIIVWWNMRIQSGVQPHGMPKTDS